MKIIPLLVESERGHDTIGVPQNQLQDAVEKQLKDDKWVTLEKEDGDTKILTESDIPKEQPKGAEQKDKQNKLDDELGDLLDKPKPAEAEDWADNFKKVRSATATNKSKGG